MTLIENQMIDLTGSCAFDPYVTNSRLVSVTRPLFFPVMDDIIPVRPSNDTDFSLFSIENEPRGDVMVTENPSNLNTKKQRLIV